MLVIATLLFLALPTPAQTAGATLLVEARDQTGAPLPGVVVTIKSDDTGARRKGRACRLIKIPGKRNRRGRG